MVNLPDRQLGLLGLILSGIGLGYLFVRLLVIPILPLDDDNLFRLATPTNILLGFGLLGFVFIGSLMAYSGYVIYCERRKAKKD